MEYLKRRKLMGRKRKRKVYFGQEVQDAIIRYNALDSEKQVFERNKIYQNEIHKAFDKLAENIINTFNDIKHETVAFMVMNIHKYDHTKGSKAFSYFSVVAKNYLILHNNNNYKKLKTHDNIDVLDNRKRMFGDHDNLDIKNFTNEIIDYFEINLPTIFKKQRDLNIAYSILDLMKQIDEIENFNKKSLYILIREMTDVNTSHITSVVNVLKKHYKKLMDTYYEHGTVNINKSGSFF
jgi:hypothetical protein